jgi:hypothetical protein
MEGRNDGHEQNNWDGGKATRTDKAAHTAPSSLI